MMNTLARSLLTTLLLAGPGLADEHEQIVTSHGISAFLEEDGTPQLKYPDGFSHFDYVNPDAPRGGIYSTWRPGTFDSLSYFILQGTSAFGSSSVFFDTLMAPNLEEADAVYGLLAESVRFPVSREWAEFTIREEARFWDGSPVTAEDVIFSLEILREKGRPIYRVIYQDIVSAEALDERTVRFEFNPDASLREAMRTAAAGIPVFSKAYWADRDFAEASLDEPMGSGPYRLSEVTPGRTVAYRYDPDYWGANLGVNAGSNTFEELRFEYFADETAGFEAFKAGEYNFREENTSILWATGYDFPDFENGYIVRERFPDGRAAGTQGWWFNLRLAKFQDPRVRQAIGLMFNFEFSNQRLFYGIYDRTTSFWQNTDLMAEGVPSAEEIALLEPLLDDLPDWLAEDLLTAEAFVPVVSSPDQMDRRALRMARRLLSDAGWEPGPDGMRVNADGERLTLEFLTRTASFERIINPYVQNLRQLGIDASVNRIDSAQYQERQKTYDYDVMTARFNLPTLPGDELRQLFGSGSAEIPGTANLSGISNPAIDSLIRTIELSETREDLEVAVRALDRVLRAYHVWVPQWWNPKRNLAWRDMFGRPYDVEDAPMLGTAASSIWWLDEARVARLEAAGALR